MWRSVTGKREDAVKVYAELLEAKGGSSLARYSVDDTDGSVNNVYWLEEIELGGAANEYGPVVASASAAVPVQTGVLPAQPSTQVIAPQPASVAGGGVIVAQPVQPAVVSQSAVQQQPQQQANQPVVQPVVPATNVQEVPQPAVAPAAEQATAPAHVSEAQAAEQQNVEPVPQPVAVVQAETATQAGNEAANMMVTGAGTSVAVVRSGQPAKAKLPDATVTSVQVNEAQPINLILPAVAGMLALASVGAAGVFFARRRKQR